MKPNGRGSLAGMISRRRPRYYFKLLAIKDEYEVARLYSDGLSQSRSRGVRGRAAPRIPLARRFSAANEKARRGNRVSDLGSCPFPVSRRVERAARYVFDIFGYTKDRRIERKLIRDYEILIAEILANLSPGNHAIAVALASIPEKIRATAM